MEISFYLQDKGVRVPASVFLDGAKKLLSILENIEAATFKGSRALTWEICELKAGSAYVGLAAVPHGKVPYSGKDVADNFLNGLAMLEKEVRPPDWTDSLLRLTSDLASLSRDRRMVIRSSNKTSEVTPRLVASAGKLLESTVESLGSVEGTLKMISTAKGTRVNIYDAITDRPVVCYIDGGMIPKAAKAINRRVSVSGLIIYDDRGYPRSIRQIVEFTVFPPDTELPTVDDLLSSDLDLAGGLTLEAFLEKRRNG